MSAIVYHKGDDGLKEAMHVLQARTGLSGSELFRRAVRKLLIEFAPDARLHWEFVPADPNVGGRTHIITSLVWVRQDQDHP